MRLVSIQVGRPRMLTSSTGRRWRSAFRKEPVAGPVALRRLNLEGDRQADPRVHGAPDMAVLCYAAAHYADWREELGRPEMGPGGFGENFTIAGQDELSACIGDVYEVGKAVVQISQPRGPCWKIEERWEMPGLLRLVEESGRHGWYLRVLCEGLVETGQELRLAGRPHPEWSVRRASDVHRARRQRPREAVELASLPAYAVKQRGCLLAAAGPAPFSRAR